MGRRGGDGAVRIHGGGVAGTVRAYLADGEKERYMTEMSKVFGKENVFSASVRKPGAVQIDVAALLDGKEG